MGGGAGRRGGGAEMQSALFCAEAVPLAASVVITWLHQWAPLSERRCSHCQPRAMWASPHQPHSHHRFPASSSKGFTTPATLRASLSGTLPQRAGPVLCSAGFTTPASHRASLSGTLLQRLHHTGFTPSIAFRHPPPKASPHRHRTAEPGRGVMHTPKLFGQTPV